MQVETKLEITASAERLLPGLVRLCQVASILALLASVLTVVAVVIATVDDQTVIAVTESGDVFNIPIRSTK